MRNVKFKNLFKRSKKAGQVLVLGGLFSCSIGTVKKPNLQQAQTKSLLKMELMTLWAKAEYRRLLGDELGAQVIERDLKKLESKINGIEQTSSNSGIGAN
jgi:hypothetical protein